MYLPVKGVDGSDLDTVDLSEHFFNLGLGGLIVNQEDHSVFVFDLLHSLFSVKGVSDDRVLVEFRLDGTQIFGSSNIFGISSQSQSSGSIESDLRVDLVSSGLVLTLSVGLSDSLSCLGSSVLGGGLFVTFGHCIK